MRKVGMVAVVFLLGASPSLALQQQTAITGDYLEDRSNRVFGCYCEWSGQRVTGGREAILGWRISQGEFRNSPLTGLKMAAVVIGEACLSSSTAPRKSLVFIDAGASQVQQQAAETLLRENFGALLGRILSIHSVPIDFQRTGDTASLRIGDLLSVTLRKADPPRDALQGAVRWYDPFIPLAGETLALTVQTKYQGAEFDERWDLNDTGISGFFGTFSLPPR